MAHLTTTMPDRVERGALRREEWSTDIVGGDGGTERRDSRWTAPLRIYEISLPLTTQDDEDYLAVKALFAEAKGSLHSFDFTSWPDDETIPVRFDGPLNLLGHSPNLDQLSFTLVEVKDPEAS